MTRLKGALLASALLLTGGSVAAENGVKPQYGGSLEIGTVYVTLSALSWDPGRLQLEAQPRHRPVLRAAVRRRPVQEQEGGRQASPSSPTPGCATDAISGELVESWEWKQDPLRVEMKVRKGVMFPEKPGVMKKRELTAEDVVFTYNRLNTSPKQASGLLRPRRSASRPPTATPSSST